MTHPFSLPTRRFALAAATLAAACASDAAPVQNAPTLVDAGTGDGGGVAPPPGCDPTADPKDAPACVVSDFAVFVDPSAGADTNPGTREAPVKTVAGGLARRNGKTRLYLCQGTYDEAISITAPVSLFGGFACGSWAYSGARATLAPAREGIPLTLRDAFASVVLADLDITARDATATGASSIAAFVVNARDVTFRRVLLAAGKAQNGVSGTPLAIFTPANAPDGTPGAALPVGGKETPNPACPSSIGGAGGKDGAVNGAGGGVAVTPVFPAGYTGAGGTTSGGSCLSLGIDGAYGLAGTAGAGAAALGTLDASGWKGQDGAPGGAGGNAQGGGGGAQRFAAGIGGSGGPGGCGGAGGERGTAGGSSIALLSFQAGVSLFQTSLRASVAGNAGDGARGQVAQLRGPNPAAPSDSGAACAGGLGGVGGSGGGAGGGAGGLSVGILYRGSSPPRVDGADTASAATLPSITLGTPGTAGKKGLGALAARLNAPISRPGQDGSDGLPGQAAAVLGAP